MDNTNEDLLQELSCIFPDEIYEWHFAMLGRTGLSLPLADVAYRPTIVFAEDRDDLADGPRDGRFGWPELKACLSLAKSVIVIPCRGEAGARYGAGKCDAEHKTAFRDALAVDGLVIVIVTGDRGLGWVAMARRYAPPECEIRVLDVEGGFIAQPIELRRAA